MSEVSCDGREDYLDQCRFDGWGDINCRHGDDVGVECSRRGSSSGECLKLTSNGTMMKLNMARPDGAVCF